MNNHCASLFHTHSTMCRTRKLSFISFLHTILLPRTQLCISQNTAHTLAQCKVSKRIESHEYCNFIPCIYSKANYSMKMYEVLILSFWRNVLYSTMKTLIMKVLTIHSNETSIPNGICAMTITETVAVASNQQNMILILLRSLATDILKDCAFQLFKLFYILFTLSFDQIIIFVWVSVFKIVLKHGLVWLMRKTNNEWACHKYIDVSVVNTGLTFGQIDAVQFNKPAIEIACSIVFGMIHESIQYCSIFKLVIEHFNRIPNDNAFVRNYP